MVKDVVVLIDREQGGRGNLAAHNLALHSAFTLTYILDVLIRHKLVTEEVGGKVRAFIAANQTTPATATGAPPPPPPAPKRLT